MEPRNDRASTSGPPPPQQMTAAVARNGEATLVEIPVPQPGPGEALVRVHATALNRADLLQVAGSYPPPAGSPETLGLELAGEIVAEGPEPPAESGGPQTTEGTATRGDTGDRDEGAATRVEAGARVFGPGDRVMALVGGGGYAEYAVVPRDQLLRVPEAMPYTEAAAVPEAFLTAWSNMVEIAGLSSGERVLIHAGASSVGLAATRIARAIGASVVVTASAGKHDACRAAGAELAIDYRTRSFAEVMAAHSLEADVVVDMVGAPYWEENIRVLRQWGRIVYIGLQGGARCEINLGSIMQKRLSIFGSTLRNRTPEEKAGLVSRFATWAAPRFERGELRPDVWRVLPFAQVRDAHELMRANANVGKIVLELG